tara:strand:+ start:616 stop:1203 length:588 start_codon:yes stop_codon:yes gene_type:complete
MKIKRFFPTPVGYVSNVDQTNLILKLCHNIANEIDKNKDLDYISSYKYPKFTQTILDHSRAEPFKEYINQFIRKIGFQSPSNIKYDFWVVRMNETITSQPTLNHPNHIISGIAYLNTGDDFSPLVIEDPRDIRYYNTIRSEAEFDENKATTDNLKEITFHPKRGDIFIWESWLKHRIELSNNTEQLMLIINAYNG